MPEGYTPCQKETLTESSLGGKVCLSLQFEGLLLHCIATGAAPGCGSRDTSLFPPRILAEQEANARSKIGL